MNTSITTIILSTLFFIAAIAVAVLVGWLPLPHVSFNIILLAVFYAAILAAYYGFAYRRAARGIDPPWWPQRLTLLEWAILTILWALARPAIQTTSPHRSTPPAQLSTLSLHS